MPTTTADGPRAAPAGAHGVVRAAAPRPGVVATSVGVLAASCAAALAIAGVGRWLRTAGATRSEVAASLPGDELLPDADVVTTRAIAVAAPPAAVWPWLVQLGWGRGGWYALDAVERVVGAARSTDAAGRTSWRSVRELVPAHQGLAAGDLVPLGDGIGMTVATLVPDDHLVLELDRLLGDVRLRWVWCFALRPDHTGCRLVVRTRTAVAPGGVGRPLQRLLLDPGHAVMELVQLRGIRDRAEATARWTVGAT